MIYAIDFGTTHSLLAAATKEEVLPPAPLDPLAQDPTLLRTLLYFPDATRCHIGSEAISEYVENGLTGRFIRSVKKHLPSRLFSGTEIDGRPLKLEDLIATFLREMRVRGDKHYGVQVDKVLLGRPARFSENPEDDAFAEARLKAAAEQAGFREVHFCPEPVAAAREFDVMLDEPKTVLVVDLGGGTSDFTVVKMRKGAWDPSDVLSIGGIAVAGDALDGSIMRTQVARHFGSEVTYTVPMGANEMKMPPALMEKLCSPADLSVLNERDATTFLRNVQRWSKSEHDRQMIDQLFTLVEDSLGFAVFEEIEKTKRALSNQEEAEFRFEYPTISAHQLVGRDRFESGATPQVRRILDTLHDVVARAGVAPADVDLVCCTGGTSRVPMIAEAIAECFGRDKMQEMKNLHSVIGGLAIRAQGHL